MSSSSDAPDRGDTVEFFHDYVDPASYLVDRILPEVADEVGVRPRPRAFELRRPAAGMLDARHPDWRRYREAMAKEAERRDVPFAPPALVPLSRKAHELALLARDEGRFPEVHDALYRAFFEGGLDLGRVDVLVDIAVECGLERAGAKAALDVDRFRDEVEEERARAERLGVRGVPTLLAGEARLEGFRPRDEILTFLRRAPHAS